MIEKHLIAFLFASVVKPLGIGFSTRTDCSTEVVLFSRIILTDSPTFMTEIKLRNDRFEILYYFRAADYMIWLSVAMSLSFISMISSLNLKLKNDFQAIHQFDCTVFQLIFIKCRISQFINTPLLLITKWLSNYFHNSDCISS